MKMTPTLSTLALTLSLTMPMAASAASVDAQSAINELRGSVANAELTLAVIEAEQTLQQIRGTEAVQHLASSIASADLAITLASANEVISNVSDSQMLAELDSLLESESTDNANELVRAVVQERPMMAAAVQNRAIEAGMDEAQVASIIFGGLSDLPATAAGK